MEYFGNILIDSSSIQCKVQRNCKSYVIKVLLSQSNENVHLLLIFQGRQTTKSDVWAFACTLWEILMLCTQQPYAELTSEQVVENSNHWYQNDGCQRYLPRPTVCPREIYDLMGECWKRNATDRPRFSEIHLFLQRKNLGYMPAPNSQA